MATPGTVIDFLNWFTLLICMFLWLNRKKLTNTDSFKVNSLHGQGINKLGNNLTVEANSEDGLIEAISIKNYPSFSVSVQWHAEYHPEKKENFLNKKLFESFGKACLKYKS